MKAAAWICLLVALVVGIASANDYFDQVHSASSAQTSIDKLRFGPDPPHSAVPWINEWNEQVRTESLSDWKTEIKEADEQQNKDEMFMLAAVGFLVGATVMFSQARRNSTEGK